MHGVPNKRSEEEDVSEESTLTEEVLDEEEQVVLRWRRNQFRALFPDAPNDDIEILTRRREVHTEDAKKLLENGCPPETALKILE